MRRNRSHSDIYKSISSSVGIDFIDVGRVVESFFRVIVDDARRLPFNNHRRIYSKDKFDEYVNVYNIPSVGRIGPVYSRYIKWRANESGNYDMKPRCSFRGGISQGEIEDIAASILSGQTPSIPKKAKNSELFERIWMVGKDGKKSANQVIPKKRR